MNSLATDDVTGLVLAGGRGSRMGGIDKGLQQFNGTPLAVRAASRLALQVGRVAINANRNLPIYEAFEWPVWPDNDPADYAGPLAGFLTGLARCETDYLLTVPCDTPLFPHDLVRRLADAISSADADIAMASTLLRPQPVFSLLRVRSRESARQDSRADAPTDMRESLQRFMRDGGRKIEAWTALHHTVLVPFDRLSDSQDAFANAKTLHELHELELR